MLTRLIQSFTLVCLSALLLASVHAADISINSSCSLADAITAANSDTATGGCPAGSGADTVSLTGNITLSAPLPVIESDITIEGNGYTISGNEQHQIFWVEETGALTIQNSTLADGRGVDDDDLYDDDLYIGGAILNFGRLQVHDSVFTGNSADWGGAIVNLWKANTSISGTDFASNSATYGGAIYNDRDAKLSILQTAFTSNSADDRGFGGAIYNLGDLEASESAFTGNSSSREGGAIDNSGEASISDSKFTENESRVGGAIHCDGYDRMNKSTIVAIMKVEDDDFISNSANSQGGAIFCARAEISVSRSTFTGNAAESTGGAIDNNVRSNISINDSVFVSNSAKSGGALSTAESYIHRSTFTNNRANNKGGAILIWGESSVSDSKFTGNTADEDGGAIFSEEVTRVVNSLFKRNAAGDEGGAIRSTEDSEFDVSHSIFRQNEAEDGGAIYSWGKLSVDRSTFINNSAEEEGGAIANHGTASINESILSENTGGDCHLGRNGELLESGDNHISDGTCGATWSGSVADGYCPPGRDRGGVCQIGALSQTEASE